MTRSGKQRRRGRSNAFQVVMVGLIFYLLLCVAGPLYLLFKLSRVELDRFETNVSKRGPLSVVSAATTFDTFHPRFNALGSRNRFEVTPEDRNLIYLLGDAFLFGYGLEDNDTVAHHLNRIDPTHKYLNLAQPRTNVIDSWARYRQTRKRTSAPRAIIVQTLLLNDIYASRLIEQRINMKVRRDHRLLLFPVTLFIDQEWLFKYYYKRVTEQILRDLSPARFERFVGRPLRDLAQAARRDRAPLFVIEYTDAESFPDYHSRLVRLCASLGASLYRAGELVSPEKRDALPDGHPGPGMNRIIAEKLSVAVKRRRGEAWTRSPSSAPAAP